ncbi:MAG TPA: hypothetical protein VNC50_07780 [Planctomycetia bacterium]|nr:hypothetical protein [Planctomycetia bacterium]
MAFWMMLIAIGAPPPPTPLPAYALPVWSPDGRYLAWVAAAGDEESLVPDGWLRPAVDPGGRGPLVAPQAELWIARAADGVCRRLGAATSFSAPAWSADGASLFVLEWRRESNPPSDVEPSQRGSLTFLKIPRDGPALALHAETAAFPSDELEWLPFETPAPSPDGMVLASPWLKPRGLRIFAGEKNEVVHRLPGLRLPSWSPDGKMLAAFTLAPDNQRLTILKAENWEDPNRAPQRPYVHNRATVNLHPAPWDRHGDAVFALQPWLTLASSLDQARIDVARIAPLAGKSAAAAKLPIGGPADAAAPAYFTMSRSRESFLLASLRPDGKFRFDRLDGDRRGVDLWHPFDDPETVQIPVGAPAYDPAGARVAFRFGPIEWGAPVAIWDVRGRRATILAPNLSQRRRALAALAASVRRIVRGADQPTAGPVRVDGLAPRLPAETPTLALLPSWKTLARLSEERRDRLLSIAEYGAALADVDAEYASPRLRRQLAEFGLLFSFLQPEFRVAQGGIMAAAGRRSRSVHGTL